MPLTHVCIWSGHGWKHITIDEAIKMRPGGTVSAKSGLFMCDLCGQYVTLAYGDVRDPYFKHSSEEKSKNCPERTFGSAYSYEFQAGVHTLPLKIQIVSRKSFDLLLGFVPVPSKVTGKLDNRKIIIRGTDREHILFQYSLSRLQNESITYLSVGSKPAKKYSIQVPEVSDQIHSYWPSNVDGVSSEGALFDGKSGKKLPEDADVRVGNKYYLVITRNIGWLQKNYQHMHIKEVCRETISWLSTWYVYEVEATAYAEDPAKFFLDFHARLTEHPVNLFPIWPVYIEKPYLILHQSTELYMYLEGEDIKSKMFPSGYISLYSGKHPGTALLLAHCNDRQQLLSAGRTKVLKYTYLWKEDLAFSTSKKEISITDDNGNNVDGGVLHTIPRKGLLRVNSKVDGFVEIFDEAGFLADKIILAAKVSTKIDSIHYGETIKIYMGLDLVWEARFEKEKPSKRIDNDLIEELNSCRGSYVAIPHALGGIAVRVKDQKIREWLYEQIHKQCISREALRVLEREILKGGLYE